MLDDLLEAAYKTFAAYPAPESLGCQCPMCRLGESQARLKAMAVREIPDELLWRYHFAAHAEKTPVVEIKHFLPRYLELVSRFQFDHFWTEVALDHLTFARGEWTAEERALLDTWAREFFLYCLTQYHDSELAPNAPYIENIVDIVIMLAHGNFDLKPLLDTWAKETHISALLHFKDLLLWGFNEDMDALENSFATDDQPLCDALAEWVRRPDVMAHFIKESDKALSGKEPILDKAPACRGGRAHREEVEALQKKLKEWRRLRSS